MLMVKSASGISKPKLPGTSPPNTVVKTVSDDNATCDKNKFDIVLQEASAMNPVEQYGGKVVISCCPPAKYSLWKTKFNLFKGFHLR